MLEIYGFSRVNEFARGNTRDLRVLWALEEMDLPYVSIIDKALLEPHAHVRSYLARCMDRPAWKRTLDAYSKRVEAA